MLIRDNQSTVNLFFQNKLVARVWTTDEYMSVKVNYVAIKTSLKSYVKGLLWGMVWWMSHHQHFGTKNVKLKFRVTYYRNNYWLLTVHKTIRQDTQSNMHKDGLHYHCTKNRQITLVWTVSENEAGYRKLQLNNSNLSRELYVKVGHNSQKYFKNLINSNLISNCPVTLEDANRANKIYGPNIYVFKGIQTPTWDQTKGLIDTMWYIMPWKIYKLNKACKYL